MAVIADMSFSAGEDFAITINVQPPIPISGWTIEGIVKKRYGGLSGLIVLSMASGYSAGQSGLTLVNGPQGGFQAYFPGIATSGWNSQPYFYQFERVDSGFNTVLAQGFINLYPGIQ